MKRIPFVILFIFFCIFFSQAQFRVALVGGGHQSKVLEDNNLPGWDTLKNNYTGRTGVHFGVMANIPFSARSNFYFQPSVLFYNKGRNYESNPETDTIVNAIYYQTRKYYINYIDIPLNIVYKFRLGKKASFMIGGGPYASLFYNGVDTKTDVLIGVSIVTEENDDLPVGKGSGKYSTLDYGVNGLAGFEFGRVILTANYSRGLKDFYQPADYTATNYKHQVMGATLGIYLGKPVQPAPKDSDGDGTPDQTDKCPQVAGPLALLGCPDTDNDGITDAEDGCPGEAGPADNRGCPYTDKDGDKILDKDDKCPEIAGSARYGGCPVPDTDGDSVNDEEDKCPDKKGTKENNGCPKEIKKEIKKEIVAKVEHSAKRIGFIVSSAELSKGSFVVLDTVAAILKRNPEINVSIEGHTSGEGNYSANMKLSQNRANKVKDYLLLKGVEASRLKSIGFGPRKLLNADKTPQEKAKNRRVELKLSN